MIINDSIAVSSIKVLLVPYNAHHVPVYHEWMQDPAIQEATASEPLSLEEEFAMCRSWWEDADKLTFIACLPLGEETDAVRANIHDQGIRLIGDVNLFLSQDEDNDVDVVGEVELMVARREDQGKGFGRAMLLAFLAYVAKHEQSILDEYVRNKEKQPTSIATVRVKIGKDNARSIKLFESIGFAKLSSGPNYFGEFELRLQTKLSSFAEDTQSYLELPYQ